MAAAPLSQKTDSELLAWSGTFAEGIARESSALGLSASAVHQYVAVQQAYADAFATATRTSTRTQITVFSKDEARAALCNATRLLTMQINSNAAVGVAMKIELGMTVPRPRTKVAMPDARPYVECVNVTAWTVRLAITESASLRRRAPGTVGAMVYTYVPREGDEPPSDASAWTLETMTGKSKVDIAFPNTLPNGSTVFVSCRWVGTRKDLGPSSDPLRIILQGGMVLPGAARRAA